MSTTGQFSSKNPTIKRILKEASELANQPSSDYHAGPLETDLFEWHFTLRGPPSPSPFEGGLYHGRIVLPPAYPLKPPSFRFLTPTGRFEVNREICLSISGHHEETWQPAWGIRTALVAIRSFMDTSAGGQLGGMDASEEVRKRLAGQSAAWKCSQCGKTNDDIMKEQVVFVEEHGGEVKKEVVPEELRLAYRENLGHANGTVEPESQDKMPKQVSLAPVASGPARPVTDGSAATPTVTTTSLHAQPQVPVQRPLRPLQQEGIPAWIDKAIYGIMAALLYLLWKKLIT